MTRNKFKGLGIALVTPFTKEGKDYISGNGTNDMQINCSSGDVEFHKI